MAKKYPDQGLMWFVFMATVSEYQFGALRATTPCSERALSSAAGWLRHHGAVQQGCCGDMGARACSECRPRGSRGWSVLRPRLGPSRVRPPRQDQDLTSLARRRSWVIEPKCNVETRRLAHVRYEW